MPFALSYNSQIWRQEGGRDWKLGHDIGYGAGWRLQAGSITPYWSAGSVHHYIFSDSTGAEYRLDVNTSGVWSSKEGIYIEYEPSAYRLYFPDGSFWVMGAVAAARVALSLIRGEGPQPVPGGPHPVPGGRNSARVFWSAQGPAFVPLDC